MFYHNTQQLQICQKYLWIKYHPSGETSGGEIDIKTKYHDQLFVYFCPLALMRNWISVVIDYSVKVPWITF